MTTFDVHSQTTAPTAAQETLANVESAYGFLPNLIGVMAEAPALAEAYATLAGIFGKTSFDATEQQVVLLTASYENGCTYCMAAHSTIAGMSKVPEDVIAGLRAGTALADPRLEALRQFTRAVVNGRGNISDDEVQRFLAAGFEKAQILEVVLGVGLKTLSNYTNHIADTPLDDNFAPRAWQKAS